MKPGDAIDLLLVCCSYIIYKKYLSADKKFCLNNKYVAKKKNWSSEIPKMLALDGISYLDIFTDLN